jgi:hypothetical protein
MNPQGQPTIIRTTAAHAPRETIVQLLGASRQNRGGPSKLTQEREGYYYAEIDHPGTAATFMAVLTELAIGHQVVKELSGKRIQAVPRRASSSRHHRPAGAPIGYQYVMGTDPDIDAAIKQALLYGLTLPEKR